VCDCLECNIASEAHLARHNNRPMRKPMVRATASQEAGRKARSGLAEAIDRARAIERAS